MIEIPSPQAVDPRVLSACISVFNGRCSGPPMRVQHRASSFPICPRKYVIYRRLAPAQRPLTDDNFIREAAAEQGTALHRVLQRWFGRQVSNHAYGNWVCWPCRKIRRHKRGVQHCRKCGREMQYQEYEIKPRKGVPFTGHIDMLLWYLERKILLDFKGSSAMKIQSVRHSGPTYEHYLQTNAYANAINRGGQAVGKIGQIDAIIILYIDRAEPHRNWHTVQMPVSKRVYRESVALIHEGNAALEERRIPVGLCQKPTDDKARWCEARDICFSPLIETKLSDTVFPA